MDIKTEKIQDYQAPDTAFQHLAVEVPGEGTGAVWEEPVDSAEYEKLR